MLRTSLLKKTPVTGLLRQFAILPGNCSYATSSLVESSIKRGSSTDVLNKANDSDKKSGHRHQLGGNGSKGNTKRKNHGGASARKTNPWSNIKKGSPVPEQRIADALKNDRKPNNGGQIKGSRNGPFTDRSGYQSNQQKSKPHGIGGLYQRNQGHLQQESGGSSDGIDKLRAAFMKSLSVDRERRQANAQRQQNSSDGDKRKNTNAEGGAESRLDQLLRMSKQKPTENYGGGQSFRERNGYKGKGYNRQNNARRSNGPSEAQLLQRELMKDNVLTKGTVGSGGEAEVETILPNRPLSILELSSIIRVQKDKLVEILRTLGEKPPRDLDNYKIDTDIAELVALELGLDPKREKRGKCSMEAAETRMRRQSQEDGGVMENELYETYPARPPVVCIMGHVDHGKTTLMDRLRQKAAEAIGGGPKKKKKSKKSKKKGKGKSNDDSGVVNMAGNEAGGITQVISAFEVQLPGMNDDDKDISSVTFLDTPGHAAFKAMRQSGSTGADVIVLVVAADDGVSPQTVEIIDMYKNIAKSQPGSISMVVAMTKIDKPGIDTEESIMKIENQLMEHDIFSERMSTTNSEFGGVQMFPVSGITGDGLDDLIEGLALQSEIMDLRACQESRAEGLVIDAKVERGLGVVADCLIRWGKLEVGNYVVSDVHGGKVRILNDVNNKAVKMVGPSQPARIVGLNTLPKAGDPIVCVKSEEIAKELIRRREALTSTSGEDTSYRADDSSSNLDVIVTGGASKKGFMKNNVLKKYGLDDNSIEEGNEEDNDDDQIRIPVILKADADGTLAALRDTLLAIQDESKLNICIDPIEISVGHVTTFDVNLAIESNAAIFCFNLKGSKDKAAMSLASTNDVEIRSNAVIYRLLDEAKDVFSDYCPRIPVEKVHGAAKVQAVFDVNNKKDAEKVAGLMVQEGNLYVDKIKTDTGRVDCEYRVRRGKNVVADRLKAKSIRRVKEEVNDVRRGEECGLSLANYTDVEEGDIIECYSIEMQRMQV